MLTAKDAAEVNSAPTAKAPDVLGAASAAPPSAAIVGASLPNQGASCPPMASTAPELGGHGESRGPRPPVPPSSCSNRCCACHFLLISTVPEGTQPGLTTTTAATDPDATNTAISKSNAEASMGRLQDGFQIEANRPIQSFHEFNCVLCQMRPK